MHRSLHSLRSLRLAVICVAPLLVPLATASAQSPVPGEPTPPPAALPGAAPEELSGVIARVQGFYDQSSSFDADFTQEYWVKQYNVKKLRHGHVTFKKPGKMQWAYRDPAGDRLVCDGRTIKVYDAANKQLYEQDANASQYPAALAFLAGQGKLSDTFDLQLIDGDKMAFPGGWVLVGSPRTPTPAYQKVFFYVDKQTFQVRRVLILDGQGNHNRFDFDRPMINTKVDDSIFRFSPPPGTSIIHP